MLFTPDIKLDSKTLDVSPVNGKIENDGTHIYFVAGGVRYQLDQQSSNAASIGKAFAIDQNAIGMMSAL